MESNMKRCINIDWLEVYCLSNDNSAPRDALFFRSKGWDVRERSYGTRVYREMFTLYNANGTSFLEVRRSPASSRDENNGLMPPNACHIRLTNYACYSANPVDRLRNFLSEYGYDVVSVYRLDICLDFVKFDSGDIPHKFIRRFMEGKYSKMNQANIHAFGTDYWERREWNSLSWGARKSMVSTKLYNKTLELREVKDKPYIRYAWFVSGLVNDPINLTSLDENGELSKPDVWRLEFSIRSTAKKWYVIERCDTTHKSSLYIPHTLTAYDNPLKLLNAFANLQKHYFRFKYFEPDLRKDRCKDKELFRFSPSDKVLRLKGNVSETSGSSLVLKLYSLLNLYAGRVVDSDVINAVETLKTRLRNDNVSDFMGKGFTLEEVKALQMIVSTCNSPSQTHLDMTHFRELTALFESFDNSIF